MRSLRRPARPAASRAAGATVVLLVLACVATVGLSWASKVQCLDEGTWEDAEQYHELCFSDLVVIWLNRDIGDGLVPYTEAALEYPVLIGAQTYVLAALARTLDGRLETFIHLHALIAAALAVAVLLALRRSGVSTRRLWCWALAPPLALYALWNWDLLAVALLVGAIVLHREGRDTAAGVATGLGAAAKLFPALLLPVLVLAALRRGAPRQALTTTVAAGAAWLAVNLPAALAAPSGWWHFYAKSMERGPSGGSTWASVYLLLFDGRSLEDVISVGSAVLFLLGATLIAVLGTRATRPSETWRLITPLVAVFLLTTKVHSPQFDLWLVPLLLLTLPTLVPFAAFVAADAAVVITEMNNLADPAVGPLLIAAVAVRAVVLVWIIATSLRRPDGTRQRQLDSSNRIDVPSGDSGTAYQIGAR